MLDDVLDAYLASVSERDFDAPLMALLRAAGFFDIHHTHGAFEFGKDVIAKRVDDGQTIQYALQSKAGNLNLKEWREVRQQLDDIRYNGISHPSFDKDLSRKAVLVLTGKLTGGAPAAAQEYRSFLESRGEPTFALWDRADLMQRMLVSPEAGLVGWVDGPLMGILSRADTLSDVDIEVFSRAWVNGAFDRSALVAAILAERLAADRPDMACFVALCLLRTAMYRSQAMLHKRGEARKRAAGERPLATRLFRAYAERFWSRCMAELLDPKALYLGSANNEILSVVTYPVRCSRIMELLGLYALSLEVDNPRRAEIRDYLAAFITNHPGAAHPISNHWAVSIIPPALLLAESHRDQVAKWLEAIVVWVADRYTKGIGLARPRAGATAEVEVLLGGPFEHVAVRRSPQCLIATTVLDLLCLTGMDDLYHDALNDVLAVGIALPAVEAEDRATQFMIAEAGVTFDVNVPYDDAIDLSESWKAAAHHHRAAEQLALQRHGWGWEFVGVSLVLRDRYFLAPLRILLRPSQGGTGFPLAGSGVPKGRAQRSASRPARQA
jgi:Restriction endonuclease